MVVNIPLLIMTILIIFLIPGFTLVQIIFPQRNSLDEKDDLLHRIILSMGLSMAIFVFMGFALSSIEPDPETDNFLS